ERVAVFGEDAPEDGVVAVRQTGPERDDEHAAVDNARLSVEHRPTSVADRPDPRCGANVVGEDDSDARRSAAEDGSVRRNGPQEPRMSPGGLRKNQATEQDPEDEGCASVKRFKKASGTRR